MTLPKPQKSTLEVISQWAGIAALIPTIGGAAVFCVHQWEMPARMDKQEARQERFEKRQELLFRDLHLLANAMGHPLPDDTGAYGETGYPQKPNVKTLTQNQKDASLD